MSVAWGKSVCVCGCVCGGGGAIGVHGNVDRECWSVWVKRAYEWECGDVFYII